LTSFVPGERVGLAAVKYALRRSICLARTDGTATISMVPALESRVSSSRGGGNEIDVALYADALRRHRKVVYVGVALTLLLAVLSVVRISPSGISYRSPQTWSNQATLVLTQAGAPELRSVLPTTAPGGSSSLADTSRFAGLVDVYAALATSDPVVQVLRRRGLVDANDMANGASPITAAAVVSTVGAGSTPMLTLTATAPSSAKATKLTLGATNAFLNYVEARQAAANIPSKDRIEIRVVKSADVPTLVKPRSKALPVLVLLGGLIATAAVVFTRDNVARRAKLPTLSAMSRRESVDRDASGGVTRARAPLGPVPQPDTGTEGEEADASGGVTQRRPTLGTVPRAGNDRNGTEEQQASQAGQARKSARPPS
jgi:hypothetical protein